MLTKIEVDFVWETGIRKCCSESKVIDSSEIAGSTNRGLLVEAKGLVLSQQRSREAGIVFETTGYGWFVSDVA